MIQKNNHQDTISIDNLIVLIYVSRTLAPQAITLKKYMKESEKEPKIKIELDSNKGTYSYRKWKNLKIGTATGANPTNLTRGVIGIYDKTNTKHINKMLLQTKNFTDDYILKNIPDA